MIDRYVRATTQSNLRKWYKVKGKREKGKGKRVFREIRINS